MRVSTKPRSEDEAKKMIRLLDDRLGDIIDTAAERHRECVEEFVQRANLGSISRLRDISTRATNTVNNQVESGRWREATDKFGSIHRELETKRVYMPDCLDGNAFAYDAFRTNDQFSANTPFSLYSIIGVTKMMREVAKGARDL